MSEIVEDERRWWACGSSVWGSVHLYEARNGRDALAAYRRDLTAADRSNGFTVREVREIQTAVGLHVVAGPLTTVQAYRYDLACALADTATRWTSEIIDPPIGDIRDEDMTEIARRVDQRCGTGTADRIQATVARTYVAAHEDCRIPEPFDH